MFHLYQGVRDRLTAHDLTASVMRCGALEGDERHNVNVDHRLACGSGLVLEVVHADCVSRTGRGVLRETDERPRTLRLNARLALDAVLCCISYHSKNSRPHAHHIQKRSQAPRSPRNDHAPFAASIYPCDKQITMSIVYVSTPGRQAQDRGGSSSDSDAVRQVEAALQQVLCALERALQVHLPLQPRCCRVSCSWE